MSAIHLIGGLFAHVVKWVTSASVRHRGHVLVIRGPSVSIDIGPIYGVRHRSSAPVTVTVLPTLPMQAPPIDGGASRREWSNSSAVSQTSESCRARILPTVPQCYAISVALRSSCEILRHNDSWRFQTTNHVLFDHTVPEYPPCLFPLSLSVHGGSKRPLVVDDRIDIATVRIISHGLSRYRRMVNNRQHIRRTAFKRREEYLGRLHTSAVITRGQYFRLPCNITVR